MIDISQLHYHVRELQPYMWPIVGRNIVTQPPCLWLAVLTLHSSIMGAASLVASSLSACLQGELNYDGEDVTCSSAPC